MSKPILNDRMRFPNSTVIPAKAGIHLSPHSSLDPRFRGDDGSSCSTCSGIATGHLVPALLFTAALSTPIFFAQPALASGLDSPMVGDGRSGVTTADAAAVHFNPGQLGFLNKAEILAGLGLVVGKLSYERERRGRYQTPDSLQFKTPVDPANIDTSKAGVAEEVGAVPIAPTGNLFAALPIPDFERLVLGLGVYVPYAATLSFPDDGAQAWQLRQAFIVSSFVTAGAAYRVLDGLSIGAGISYVGGLAELSKVQDFASLGEFQRAFANEPINQDNDFGPGAPSEVRELEVLSRSISVQEAVSHGVTFNAGLAFRFTPAFDLGLVYQHGAAMRYQGKFSINMDDDLFTQDLAAQGLRYDPLVEGDAEIAFSLPKRMTLGAGYRVNDSFRLSGFASYIFYSDLDAFEVTTTSPQLAQPKLGLRDTVSVQLPRYWNDTIWIEAMGAYRLTDSMLVSASLGYQSPAAPDETIDAASPDGHRLLGGIGGALDLGPTLGIFSNFALSGDVRLQGILPRTVTDSAHDLGNGTYRLFIATIAGHIKAQF